MKIRAFEAMESAFIDLTAGNLADPRELDKDTLPALDARAQTQAITLEHAADRRLMAVYPEPDPCA